ncbi:MAG: hypothetical protein ACLFWF_04960 [Alphaproteobacteria bacterium]
MRNKRLIGLALIVIGIAAPQAIDAYETAHRLDIPRDIGVLPWLVMTIAGIWVFAASFRKRNK